EAKRGGKLRVVRDGVESKNLFDGMGDDCMRFSPDGKHFVYAGRIDTKWSFVIDDKPSPGFFKIGEGGVHISPDSKSLAFVVIKAEKQATCVVDGKPGKEYARIDPIVYSA